VTSRMRLTRVMCASTLAAGIGLTGLFGLGLGTAGAEPGPGCGRPGAAACDNRGPGQPQGNWQGRGIDQARSDHQPFNWNGQQVNPMRDGRGQGWGFWFLGQWIPL
jgi:hypothetical protein